MKSCKCTPLCQHCDAQIKYTSSCYCFRKKTCSCGKQYSHDIPNTEFQHIQYTIIDFDPKTVWPIPCRIVESAETDHATWCPRNSPCFACDIPIDGNLHRMFNTKSKCPRMPADVYRRLWDLWQMYVKEYTSYLQWLPKEMLEDVMVVMDSVELQVIIRRPPKNLLLPWISSITLSIGYNQEDSIIFDRSYLNTMSTMEPMTTKQLRRVYNRESWFSHEPITSQPSRNPTMRTVKRCVACVAPKHGDKRKHAKKQDPNVMCMTCFKQY